MYVYLNFVLILNQCLKFMLVYCIYCIYYLWKHFFITLAAYWSPFVTNMFKQFIILFFVVVVLAIPQNGIVHCASWGQKIQSNSAKLGKCPPDCLSWLVFHC